MPKPGGDPSSGISLGDVLRLPERHRACSGAKLNQALVWNVRTCAPMQRERSQANREDQSTDAEHRDGAVRSRDEGPVMGLD